MLLLLISMTLLLPAYAAFDNPPIIDDAGYLMQSELAKLSEELEQIREKYNFEVAIYTESEMSGNTAEEVADDPRLMKIFLKAKKDYLKKNYF